LANGEIGVLELMRSKSMVLWNLESSQIAEGLGAPVSLVKTCNLNKSKVPGGASPKKRPKGSKTDELLAGLEEDGEEEITNDLIVARDNGRIEIYNYVNDNPYPTLCFETQIKSTITGFDVGYVTMANSKDILLTCYDGKILALVDSKKFKKQGIMANENIKPADD